MERIGKNTIKYIMNAVAQITDELRYINDRFSSTINVGKNGMVLRNKVAIIIKATAILIHLLLIKCLPV